MASKTLFESVMWGTSKQVQDILSKRDLPIDDNYTDYALLLTSLRRRRKEVAKILLNKGCRVRKVPSNDKADSPLHLAVKLGDVEIVKMLLDRGAAVDTVDQNGESPLYLAMKKGCHDIVDLILSASDVDCANTSNKDGLSHFHVACIRNNVGVVENFVKKGVDVNCTVNFAASEHPGFAPLHFAVEYNCVDTVKLLLRCNADPTVKNADDKTPLYLAMQKQSNEMADVILSLVSDSDSNPVDDDGLSHFHIACMKHHLSAVKNFLLHGVDVNQAVKPTSTLWPGSTALHFAVRGLSVHCKDQIEVIELLLRHKADVNAQDVQGQTPLHLACLQSDEKISKLIQDIFRSLNADEGVSGSLFGEKLSSAISQIDQVKIVDLLLKHKSDVNVANIVNETPLFYLYKYDRSKISNKCKLGDDLITHVIGEFNKNRREILKILLNHGADVNAQNDTGQSILHVIAGISKSCDDDQKEEVAELVLNRGANVDASGKYGSTPLHLASQNGHVKLMELLLRYKADVNTSEAFDQSTPLHQATTYQQTRAIEVLLANGADVTATKCNNMNVLHIMALINPDASQEPEFIESYEKIMNTFIECGCEINAQDLNGRTPLHLASWDNNNAATWILLRHFADINIEDFAGETPLSFLMNSSDPRDNIYFIIRDFINMLRFTGFYVSKKNERCYNEIYKGVFLNTEDDFLVQCREEIERMKFVRINNDTSLYDIMFKSSNEMVVHAGNEILEEILKSSEFESQYNIYKYLLKSQFRKGLARKRLLKSAKDSLEFMTGFGFSDSCSDKILQHLCDESLRNVVKAKTVALAHKGSLVQQKTAHEADNSSDSVEKALAYCQSLFDRQMEIET